MDKPGLLALVAQQNSDLVAAVNALPDGDADVAALQAQLDAANAALKSETDLDAADAAKAVALQAKIDAALLALSSQPAAV